MNQHIGTVIIQITESKFTVTSNSMSSTGTFLNSVGAKQ
jgi:hypothetical protein